MDHQQFGFGIIGAGTISGIHAKAIAAIPGAKLYGVYSKTATKSKAFAKAYNCKAYETYEAMLAAPEIDIICICTPSGLHMDPALQALQKGKHCVIEKPLEVSLDKCDRIIEASQETGLKTAVIFPSRFYDASQQMRKAMNENRFGNLVLGDAYVKWSRSEAYYNSADWRGTWALDGGGALMNQGIHSVDLLQWYMGEVKSVQAVTANIRHKNIEVEDTVVATLEYANGALGVIQCSTAVYPGTLKRIELMGDRGSAILEESNIIKWEFENTQQGDSDVVKTAHSSFNGGVSDPSAISFFGHQKQLEDIMDSITHNRSPMIDAVEGRKSVAIVLAIYESAKTGKKVSI